MCKRYTWDVSRDFVTNPGLITFMDELTTVDKEIKTQMFDIATRRQITGKTKLVKKQIKKLNKARRKHGLKKLKVKEIHLKLPKGWNAASLVGFPRQCQRCGDLGCRECGQI